jgi:hypothetical protein
MLREGENAAGRPWGHVLRPILGRNEYVAPPAIMRS